MKGKAMCVGMYIRGEVKKGREGRRKKCGEKQEEREKANRWLSVTAKSSFFIAES